MSRNNIKKRKENIKDRDDEKELKELNRKVFSGQWRPVMRVERREIERVSVESRGPILRVKGTHRNLETFCPTHDKIRRPQNRGQTKPTDCVSIPRCLIVSVSEASSLNPGRKNLTTSLKMSLALLIFTLWLSLCGTAANEWTRDNVTYVSVIENRKTD
ncbi:hypothetical protein KQX54_020776 [Cotesia glomerata]|uniref:Uncharacterized protein n=1 Tax=Cotesia glomerata TaxID=32391 RepID=A0AAV7I0E5_COTGL|nr:hypothetical protein KQX54_020776 [Cotesia glomerata]